VNDPAGPARLIEIKDFWRAIGERAIGAAVVTAADIHGPAAFWPCRQPISVPTRR